MRRDKLAKARDHPGIRKRVLEASRRLIIRHIVGGPQTASHGGHRILSHAHGISLLHLHIFSLPCIQINSHIFTYAEIHIFTYTQITHAVTWQRFKPRSDPRRHPLNSRLFYLTRTLIGSRVTKRSCLLVGSLRRVRRRDPRSDRKEAAFIRLFIAPHMAVACAPPNPRLASLRA